MRPIDIAIGMLGLQEVRDRNIIQQFLRKYAHNGDISIDPSKVSWCSAFVNGCVRACSLVGTGSLMARSWLNWGQPVNEDDAKEGDIVVFDFEHDNVHGHVAMFIKWNDDDNTVTVIGGNQNNMIKYSNYIQDTVVGIRREDGLN